MQSASSLTTSDLAVLIVGDPGARKTTLACHFPSPYFFDVDGNLAAPINYLRSTGMDVTSIKFDRGTVDDHGTLIPPADRYLHMVKCLNVAAADPTVKTIILDSLTTLTDILLSEVKRQEKLSDTATLRIQDWGKFSYLIRDLITKMRTCGKIFVVLAHNKMEQDESDKRWKLFLNLPGNNATTVSGLFTDVWNPYPVISGLGSAQTHKWMIRALPASETDHRGIKSSLGLPVITPYEDLVKKIKTL